MRLRLALLTIWGGAALLAQDTVDYLAARQVRLEDGKLEEFAIQIEKPTPEKAPATKKTGR